MAIVRMPDKRPIPITKATPKMPTKALSVKRTAEAHTYNWRSRNNLKRGRG